MSVLKCYQVVYLGGRVYFFVANFEIFPQMGHDLIEGGDVGVDDS